MAGHKKKATTKQKRKRKLILFIIEIIVLIILLVGVFYASKLNKINRQQLDESKVEKAEVSKETEETLSGYTDIALFGLDNRSNGDFQSGNSDSMIIASINNKTGEIKMCSLYRDTYLDISGADATETKFRKANAAYAAGGPERAVNMMNKNLDLSITDYVSVDFNALVDVVDLLGGIDLDEPLTDEEAMYMNGASGKEAYIDTIQAVTGKSSSYVSSGQTHLDGVQATAYARIRYTTGWDFKRTERQRIVISKMFDKAKTAGIGTLNSILDQALPEVSTSLSTAELTGLMLKAGKYHMGDNTGFPFDNTTGSVGELGDLVIPVDLSANVKQLHEFLYDDTEYTPSQEVQKISDTIRNNTGV